MIASRKRIDKHFRHRCIEQKDQSRNPSRPAPERSSRKATSRNEHEHNQQIAPLRRVLGQDDARGRDDACRGRLLGRRPGPGHDDARPRLRHANDGDLAERHYLLAESLQAPSRSGCVETL